MGSQHSEHLGEWVGSARLRSLYIYTFIYLYVHALIHIYILIYVVYLQIYEIYISR